MTSKKDKKRIAISLISGVIFGLFALIGSFVGNFLWWYQSRLSPEVIWTGGFVSIVAFFGIALLIFHVALKNL